jgi:hypothetical protein
MNNESRIRILNFNLLLQRLRLANHVGCQIVRSLEKVIAGGHEIVADFNLKWKYDAAKMANDYDPSSAGGGHVMLIIGYDRKNQIFTLKNSWGGTAFTRVTYNFMKNCIQYASYVTDVRDPKLAPQPEAGFLGRWYMDHDGWRGTLVLRRFVNFHNSNPKAATRLGHYYDEKGVRKDVNGYFIENGRGVVFYIADNSNPTAFGTLKGQLFTAYLYSWDPRFISGTTVWAGKHALWN